ncbi:MAG: PIG-L deacetylase family protein [Desulfovibrionaceae bacterium]
MNILAVGAHFDDVELGCGGTLIKHVRQGDRVHIIVVSESEYRNPKGETIRDAEVAEAEGRAAAAIIGASLECLGFKTFHVPFAEELTSLFDQRLKDLAVDMVYTHWPYDVHRDHQFVTKNVLMAARHVPRVLAYRSNHYDAEQPFRGTFYSDISDDMEQKIACIKCHVSELERVNYAWVDFFRRQNQNDGMAIGVEYAERFEVIRYLV